MPGSIKALRLHNLLLGGGLTGAQLEAELANALKAGAFEASLRQRTVVGNLKASPSALTGVAGSVGALQAAFRQDMTVFNAVIAAPTALSAVVGSASAMSAIAASATAMSTMVGSGTASSALAGSATAMAVRAGSDW